MAEISWDTQSPSGVIHRYQAAMVLQTTTLSCRFSLFPHPENGETWGPIYFGFNVEAKTHLVILWQLNLGRPPGLTARRTLRYGQRLIPARIPNVAAPYIPSSWSRFNGCGADFPAHRENLGEIPRDSFPRE